MATNLPWFKHYNNAFHGSSFAKLRADRDFETMACYWMLLELISIHENRDQDEWGFIEIPHRLLHQTWNVSSQRATKIIGKIVCNFVNTISLTKLERTYQVFCHNWRELQETRGGKREAKIDQKTGRGKKEEVRGKKEDIELEKDNTNTLAPRPKASVADAYSGYGQKFKEAWKARYGIDIPEWSAKRATIIKNWVRSVGLERAEEYMRLYVAWNDPFIVRAGHPPELMVTRTNSFVTDLSSKRVKVEAAAQYKTSEDKITKEVKDKSFWEDLKKHEQKLQQELNRGTSRSSQPLPNPTASRISEIGP